MRAMPLYRLSDGLASPNTGGFQIQGDDVKAPTSRLRVEMGVATRKKTPTKLRCTN